MGFGVVEEHYPALIEEAALEGGERTAEASTR